MKNRKQFASSIVSRHLHSQREQMCHKDSTISARKFIEYLVYRILQLIAFITQISAWFSRWQSFEFFCFSIEFCVGAIYSMIKFLSYTSTKTRFLIHFPHRARGNFIRSYSVSKFTFPIVSVWGTTLNFDVDLFFRYILSNRYTFKEYREFL